MIHCIYKDLERLGLHDSHITNITRSDKEIVVVLSHGYLSNFKEEGISEAIMFDAAILTISNIKRENYRSSFGKESALYDVAKPDLFDTQYSLIATNDLTKNHDSMALKLGVIRNKHPESDHFYVEWEISFEYIKLEWDKHILQKDWLSGADKL